MGTITAESSNLFKSASIVYGKVNRVLSSFGAANLIDEGEFPTYIKEELRELGIGVYKEQEVVIKVKNFKAALPKDFSILYAAYKCTPSFNQKDRIHPQGGARVFNDITWEVLDSKNGCEIDCCSADSKIIESITVRRYVEEKAETVANLTNPILLRLGPNVKKNMCTDDCQNLLASSAQEITINDGFIYTNFDKDCIYMKYWGLATDENGVPEIPDSEKVQKSIEWYIIYQLAFKWYYNNQVPDFQARYKEAEANFQVAHDRAKYELKMPSFSRMVNMIRRNRSTNLLQLMRQMDSNSYWSCR